MVKAAFEAWCPFEIGDTLNVTRPGTDERERKIITDIVCIHSLKKQTVEFWLELDGERPLAKMNVPEEYRTVWT